MPYKLFAVFGLALIVLLGVVGFNDYNREWKKYQTEFFKLETLKAVTAEEKASLKHSCGIKQIMVPELNKADRCITCHLGFENPKFKEENVVYKTHPNPEQHSFDRFGCTICHRGQGRATTVKGAHGKVSHWPEPMLEKEYVQVSCGKCHSETEVKGAPLLTLGRKLYAEKGCGACHKIEGKSDGALAPELTTVGSKYKHEFNYKNIKGEHTAANWIYEHFKDPQAITPGTIMPAFGFTDEEAKALTLYMLSLTREKVPHEYKYQPAQKK